MRCASSVASLLWADDSRFGSGTRGESPPNRRSTRGHDHGLTRRFAHATISMGHRRIEVDGITRLEFIVVEADLQAQPSLQYVKKLRTRMLVRLELRLIDGLEVRQIRVGSALVRFEVKAL